MFESSSKVHYTHIYNIYSRFFAGFGNLLKDQYFTRSKDVVISTYEKAIEMYRKGKNTVGENWYPEFPFVVINPSLSTAPTELFGNFLYNYPHWDTRMAADLYSPRLYDDGNVFIAPVLNSFTSTIDVIVWCSSVYELIDMTHLTIQKFGGMNRYTVPSGFESIIIIPDEFKNYEYENTYTGESYTLDWSGNTATNMLIKQTNKEEFVFPFHTAPRIKLVSISDGDDKYGGGADAISDHKVVFTIEYDVMIPCQLVIVSKNFPIPAIPLEYRIDINFKYIRKPNAAIGDMFAVPDEIVSVSRLTHAETTNQIKIIFDKVVNYEITAEDVTQISNKQHLVIPIDDPGVLDERYIKIHSSKGYLDRDIFWRMKSATEVEFVYSSMVEFVEGEYISIIIYKDEYEDTL